MPRRWLTHNRMIRPQTTNLQKLLGDLEIQIMEHMWAHSMHEEATVRDVASVLQLNRPVAYTTIMTVMSHLSDKGLLVRRALDGKTYVYQVALTREEFLARSSQQMVNSLIQDFGDLALAQFLAAVEGVGPGKLRQLRQALAETTEEDKSQEGKEGKSFQGGEN